VCLQSVLHLLWHVIQLLLMFLGDDANVLLLHARVWAASVRAMS
jgi:hypothetical protein